MYSMQDLIEASGYSRHTIYRLTRAGLLARPTGTGRYARYTSDSMRRLLEYRRRMDERDAAEDLIEQLGGDPDAYRRSRG